MPAVSLKRRVCIDVGPLHHVGVQVLDCAWLWLPNWIHNQGVASPFWRFYWNGNRGAYVLLNGRRTDLIPSRCYLIPPRTPFDGRNERPVWHFCLHFLTIPIRLQLAPGIYSHPLREPLRHILAEIGQLLQTENPQTFRRSLLVQALAYEALYCIPGKQLVFDQKDERIDHALRLMETHRAAPLSVTELARRSGMELRTFIRLFKQTTGQTPQHYCCRLRLDHAITLLITSRLSIKEIAEETGFCDRYHFSRVFARSHDVGPAQFRISHGGRLAPTTTSSAAGKTPTTSS